MSDRTFIIVLVAIYAGLTVIAWFIRDHISEMRALRLRVIRVDHQIVRLLEHYGRLEQKEKKEGLTGTDDGDSVG